MAPRIFFVPGFWEGPESFKPLVEALGKAGLVAKAASLATTGTKAPGNPTIQDNVATIREQLLPLLDEAGEEGVVVVCHSAGGFMGSAALEGMSPQARKTQGQVGGVLKIVLFAAIVYAETKPDELIPQEANLKVMESQGLLKLEGGQWLCINPEKILFNDMSPEEATTWIGQMKPEPSEGWSCPLTNMGWSDIPSVYLLCELDCILPPPLQEQFAALARSKIEKISAGHMAHLSQTAAVANILMGIVAEVTVPV